MSSRKSSIVQDQMEMVKGHLGSLAPMTRKVLTHSCFTVNSVTFDDLHFFLFKADVPQKQH